jgi:hypothetical protein
MGLAILGAFPQQEVDRRCAGPTTREICIFAFKQDIGFGALSGMCCRDACLTGLSAGSNAMSLPGY